MGDFKARMGLEDLPDGTVILPGAIEVTRGSIPVYLPDRTEVGVADIVETEDGMFAMVKLNDGAFAGLMHEGLVGLSVVSIAAQPMGDLLDEAKEKETEE